MNKVVVDTSVVIAVLTSEATREALIELTSGAELLAPISLHWEVGNAFSAMLRRRRITLSQAAAALQGYGQIPIRLLEVDLVETLTIAADWDIYAYDAYMLRCALDHGAPLLTLDQGLMHAAREAGVEVLEVIP